MSKRSRTHDYASPGSQAGPIHAAPTAVWLTRVALGLAIAVVAARLMMTESIRSVVQVYPNAPAVPAGPGPSSGLLLDLLAGLCPLLVLLRRWVDPSFTLRAAWSAVAFVALAAWAVASTAWASDRFAAIISSVHLLSAAGVLWAVAQICRTPAHTRVVAGFAAGMLAVLLIHGLWFQFVERPALKEEWDKNRDQILASRNIQPGTFEYIQFENKVLRGELMGFSASPNTYAAMLVLLGLVTLGTAAQLVRNGRLISAGAMLLVLLVTAAVLPLTQSRTGYLTAVLGVVLLALTIALGSALRRRATLLYLLGVLAVLGVTAFVVGYGASRGTLFHDSLNFRWRYWVGSFEVWKLHPLLGVGWENFGAHYLGVRLPEATEEIKDPHNFFVRFATELGTVGAILAAGWMALIWWSLSRPAGAISEERDDTNAPASSRAIAPGPATLPLDRFAGAAAAIAFGFVLNFFAATDLSQDSGYALFEGFRVCGYLLAALVVASFAWLTIVREGRESALRLDADPAALIRVGLVVGVGMFFVHNLIDFAMFEFGPMFMMALLLGAALGRETSLVREPSLADQAPARNQGRRAARIALAIGSAAWLIGAVALVIPVVSSESVAAEADASFRKNVPAVAAKGYESAFQNSIANGDYAYRAATAWRWAGDPARSKAMLDLAIAASPLDAGYRVARAELARTLRPAADKLAADDYAAAIKLDPNNRENRIRYADVLEKLTLPREAAEQLEKVLELNDRLTKEEKKRLSEAQVADINQKIMKLRGRR
ncbi:O-antigen ligase family protein [Humisphaera borealis]|uniref:O-antigen ligase family protein n=1 Tax=Humisphaera borealis TaxID=2807512 RepID=A0A7M2X4A6_9BACT|nr:O-antigen ligase family protein [Humisphaera borealis]QOV92272.1 O-antigen ligase family protein [Humisphaera borealis]